jgi:hypothetical protein
MTAPSGPFFTYHEQQRHDEITDQANLLGIIGIVMVVVGVLLIFGGKIEKRKKSKFV